MDLNLIQKLMVLGSTGSVGHQALDVARHLGVEIAGIAVSSNAAEAEKQIRKYKIKNCAVSDEKAAAQLKLALADTDVRIIAGDDAAEELAGYGDCDLVLNAISGIAGLRPALSALNAHHDLALANKETLVVYGKTVMETARRNGVRVYPVDSEHCAIEQCLAGNSEKTVSKLILTASGGPFFGMTREEMSDIPPERALEHPTWKMGARITIDSATMMNKGLEVIEAARLFGVPGEKIEVIINRESIIHSMVEYIDNAVMAQLSVPDMRLCIQYALTGGQRTDSQIERLNLPKLGALTFFEPDRKAFPLLGLAYKALYADGLMPAAMNAADEVAVEKYIKGQIRFGDIADIVELVAESCGKLESPSLAEIEASDREARELAYAAADKCRRTGK